MMLDKLSNAKVKNQFKMNSLKLIKMKSRILCGQYQRSFILWWAMKSWPKPPFSWFVWVIAQAQAMACGSCQGMLYVHLYRQGLNYSDHNHKLELMLFMWIIKFYETYLWWCKFLGKYSDKRKFENKPSFWDSETLHTLQIWKPGK